MKDKMVIAQLRGTIFVPVNIGYTPENFTKFSELLLPGAEAYNAYPPEMIAPGMNPNKPLYGLAWRLFKKDEEEGANNIVFLPGKIDVILTKDIAYGGDTERVFCEKCIDWFSKILVELNTTVNRIAYAPLYAIKKKEADSETIWGSFLKRTVIDGNPLRDVNFNFLLKREIPFNGQNVQMNLLHNLSDGVQIKQSPAGNVGEPVVLLQLDLNSIPEISLSLKAEGVKDFFNGILEVKDSLIANVTE